jgi:hemoglobin
LARAFYRRVATDDLLRPLYPQNTWANPDSGKRRHGEGLCSPIDRLAAFLAQFFGGPPVFSDQRGAPRLKQRHVKFKIGQAERDAWLTHMAAAIDEVGIEEPARSLMRQYFSQASTFLINMPPAGAGEPE